MSHMHTHTHTCKLPGNVTAFAVTIRLHPAAVKAHMEIEYCVLLKRFFNSRVVAFDII